MPARFTNEYGNIIIEDNVLASIAGTAAIECYGLVGMASKGAGDGLSKLLLMENLSKGVKITTEENGIIIDLYIIVQFGISISTVASNVIEKVKYAVEEATGMYVERVNVNVQGVRVQK